MYSDLRIILEIDDLDETAPAPLASYNTKEKNMKKAIIPFKGYIYKLTSPSGKVYIGKTSAGTVEERWNKHCWNAANGEKSKLYTAILKYGPGSFVVETVCEVNSNEDNLLQIEICEIWIHKSFGENGYNLTIGGDGLIGFVFSEDSKEKRSKSMMGVQRALGSIRSPEQKSIYSITISKPFSIVSPDGILHEGTNLSAFCKENGLNNSHIHKVINGKSKSAKGWTSKESILKKIETK